MGNYPIWYEIPLVFELEIETDSILDALTGLAI